MKRAVLFLLLFFVFTATKAQSKLVNHQKLYWLRYYSQVNFNSKLCWHNEFDNRKFFENNQQNQFFYHTRLHYKTSKNTEIAAGMTYVRQNSQSPAANSAVIVPEIRPNQEFTFTVPVNKQLKIQQRVRMDERFIHKSSGKELIEGYNFNLRIRYRLQASYILNKKETKTPTTLKAWNELMVNVGKIIVYNQFDQNRAYVGVEQNLSKNISVELGYLHLYQQRPNGFEFFDRDIVRFTLYHKVNL